MTGDPLQDPRFPDRPQHPDFWRLAEVAMANDGDATEAGRAVFDILDVDEESFLYLAKTRVRRYLDQTGAGDVESMLLTAYIDAFALGRGFERHGGHRDG